MIVRVLGSAAGGGLPQWNCACARCAAARAGTLRPRLQASIAVSAEGRRWVVVNATSDIRAQVERTPALQPRRGRETPIAAVVLTDANIDHSVGLLDLRQAAELAVYSSAAVRGLLCANDMFAPFARGPRAWRDIDVQPQDLADARDDGLGISCAALPVPSTVPSYAASAADGHDHGAVACVLSAGGATLVYAPVFSAATEQLRAALLACDACFLDGSFWSDDELPALALGARTAREMGHAPVQGSDGALRLCDLVEPGRCFLTHLNNTNPMLDPASPEAEALQEAGAVIAEDGMEIVLERRREAAH